MTFYPANNVVRSTAFALYVAPAAANASDGNNGDILTPLATIDGALARIGDIQADSAVIHLGNGTYLGSQILELARNRQYAGQLVIVGDGAGNGADDGFTVVEVAQANAGPSTALDVVGAGFVAGALVGLTVEITSGAAIGARRTIISNTTTVITFATPTPVAVGVNDTFRVIRSAVIIDLNTAPAAGTRVMGAKFGDSTPSWNPDGLSGGRLTLINMRFETSGIALRVMRFSGLVNTYGLEVDIVGSLVLPTFDGAFCAGYDSMLVDATGPTSAIPETILGIGTDLWTGWGLFMDATGETSAIPLQASGGMISGMIAGQTLLVTGGALRLLGGVWTGDPDAGTAVPTIIQEGNDPIAIYGPKGVGNTVSVLVETVRAVALIFLTAGKATLGAIDLDFTAPAATFGVDAAGDVMALTDSTLVFGASAATNGFRARRGARIHTEGLATADGTGADLAVGEVPATGTAASLAAAGDHLSPALVGDVDGSIVQRVS